MKKLFTYAFLVLTTAGFAQNTVSVSGNVSINGTPASGELIQLYVEQLTPTPDSLYVETFTDSSGNYILEVDVSVISTGTSHTIWTDCNGIYVDRENSYSATSLSFEEDFACTSNQDLYVTIYTKNGSTPYPGEHIEIDLNTTEGDFHFSGSTDASGLFTTSFNFRHPTEGIAILTWVDDCHGENQVDTTGFDTRGIMQIGKHFDCQNISSGFVQVYGSVTRDGVAVEGENIIVEAIDNNNSWNQATQTASIVDGTYETMIELDSTFSGIIRSSWLNACDSIMTKVDTIFHLGTGLTNVIHDYFCYSDSTVNNQDSIELYVSGNVTIDGNPSYPDFVHVYVYSDQSSYVVEQGIPTNANGYYTFHMKVASFYTGRVETQWDDCHNNSQVKETSVSAVNQPNIQVNHSFACSTNTTHTTIYGYVFEDDSAFVDLADVYLYKRQTPGNRYFVTDTFTITPNNFGMYEFEVEKDGEYLTKAIPSNNNGYLSTYHYQSIRWNQADVIVPNTANNFYDIILINESDANGNGNINGSVSEEERGGLPFFMMNAVLTDQADNPLFVAEVDDFGDFSFTGIPNGTYHLSIDYPGFTSDYAVITLDDNHQQIDGLVFEVGENSISSGISDVNTLTALNLYPNPTNSFMKVQLSDPTTGTIDIIDHLGRSWKTQVLNNEHEINMDLSQLPKGVYYIKLQSGNLNVVEPIVKY